MFNTFFFIIVVSFVGTLRSVVNTCQTVNHVDFNWERDLRGTDNIIPRFAGSLTLFRFKY